MTEIDQEHVLFSRGINPQSINDLVALLHDISTRGKNIHLVLNSPGGNVHAGIYCYNMIRAIPVQVDTHNIGNVDSIANVVFMAGERRVCTSSATFMFHGVGFDAANVNRLELPFLREKIDSIIADHKRIATIIASHSLLTLRMAAKLFEEQRVYDAAWAKSKGMVHEIADFNLPAGAHFHCLT